MTNSQAWLTQVKIPDDLRRFISLSASDVHTLMQSAAKAADPVQHIQGALIAKAETKKQEMIRRDVARMAEDKRRIEATHLWPLPWLPIKSQPWITNLDGRMAFGRIEADDLLTVLQDGAAPRTFASLDDLVQWWSVD